MDKKVLIIIIAVLFIFVILPVLVIGGLVAMGLLLQVNNQGSNIPEVSAKTAWKSAEPFGIVDYSRSGDTLTIIVKNNTADTLTLNSLQAKNLATFDSSPIAAYSTRTLKVSGLGACSSGTKYAIPKSEIIFNYSTKTFPSKTMIGVADIVGTC